MPKLSFIFRTDVHVADKSPPSWKGDYPAEVWSNLEQVGELARKHLCRAVLDGGDFFHVKAPTKNSHAIVAKASHIHACYPCETWSIEGNHDIKHNNLESIDEQPLGVLYKSGVFKLLRDEVFESGSLRVRVVGVPYSPFRTLEELQSIRKGPDDTYLVAIVHALAGRNPPAHVDDFFGEPVFRYEDLVYEKGPDVFCFGHWHRDQGIVEIEGRKFVNQGAVSRGALIRENTERTPQVSLLEFEDEVCTATTIPLKVIPAAEAFDFERKERQEQERRDINQYVENIRTKLLAEDLSDGVDKTVGTLDFPDEVRSRALSYLEQVRDI